MKALILAIVLFSTVAYAEDQMGYVLRRDWWGVEYYWVHDSDKWGETSGRPAVDRTLVPSGVAEPANH